MSFETKEPVDFLTLFSTPPSRTSPPFPSSTSLPPLPPPPPPPPSSPQQQQSQPQYNLLDFNSPIPIEIPSQPFVPFDGSLSSSPPLSSKDERLDRHMKNLQALQQFTSTGNGNTLGLNRRYGKPLVSRSQSELQEIPDTPKVKRFKWLKPIKGILSCLARTRTCCQTSAVRLRLFLKFYRVLLLSVIVLGLLFVALVSLWILTPKQTRIPSENEVKPSFGLCPAYKASELHDSLHQSLAHRLQDYLINDPEQTCVSTLELGYKPFHVVIRQSDQSFRHFIQPIVYLSNVTTQGTEIKQMEKISTEEVTLCSPPITIHQKRYNHIIVYYQQLRDLTYINQSVTDHTAICLQHYYDICKAESLAQYCTSFTSLSSDDSRAERNFY